MKRADPIYDRRYALCSDKTHMFVDVDAYGTIVGPRVEEVLPWIGKPLTKLVKWVSPQGNYQETKFETKYR